MLFELEELPKNESVTRTMTLGHREIPAFAGSVALEDIRATLDLRRRGKAFAVDYDVRATAETTCVRCDEPITIPLAEKATMAVRTEQPEASHILLGAGDMNVRFLGEPRLDLEHLVLEICELALPDYPRHQACEAEPEAASEEDDVAEAAPTSPFRVLSRFIDS